MAIKEFKKGHYYKLSPEGYRFIVWNLNGEMDALKDKEYHLCTKGYNHEATFEKAPRLGMWNFSGALKFFDELKSIKVSNWKERLEGRK